MEGIYLEISELHWAGGFRDFASGLGRPPATWYVNPHIADTRTQSIYYRGVYFLDSCLSLTWASMSAPFNLACASSLR